MNVEFSGEMRFWRGPAPWHFITVPDDECHALRTIGAAVSYGWGMIPVTAQINGTRWKAGGRPSPLVPAFRPSRDAYGRHT